MPDAFGGCEPQGEGLAWWGSNGAGDVAGDASIFEAEHVGAGAGGLGRGLVNSQHEPFKFNRRGEAV